MITYRDLLRDFHSLEIGPQFPVLAHASLGAFGEVRGGADALIGALLRVHPRLMMPAHTYKTMIIPENGPDNNGIIYGAGESINALAEVYDPAMPVDRLMGATAEALRRHPQAQRSSHPILSFSGIGVDNALAAQTIADPLAPIGSLAEEGGWVLQLGVNHTTNTALHFAEKMAGRRTFLRWALTQDGIQECPFFPGCSLGFKETASLFKEITREIHIGTAQVRALPLQPMLTLMAGAIHSDPLAFLCSDPACERCAAVRESAV